MKSEIYKFWGANFNYPTVSHQVWSCVQLKLFCSSSAWSQFAASLERQENFLTSWTSWRKANILLKVCKYSFILTQSWIFDFLFKFWNIFFPLFKFQWWAAKVIAPKILSYLENVHVATDSKEMTAGGVSQDGVMAGLTPVDQGMPSGSWTSTLILAGTGFAAFAGLILLLCCCRLAPTRG